jgi:hypothetical protein
MIMKKQPNNNIDLPRRKLIQAMFVAPMVGVYPLQSRAFLPVILRFFLVRGVKRLAARGLVQASRHTKMARNFGSTVTRYGAGATSRRVVAGSTMAGAGGVEAAVLALDIADLAANITHLDEKPDTLYIPSSEDLYVDISGKNQYEVSLDGLLSIALFDDEYAAGGNGFVERIVLGDVSTPPSGMLSGSVKLSLASLEPGRPIYVAPFLAHPASDNIIDLEFYPAVQIIESV